MYLKKDNYGKWKLTGSSWI